MPRVTLIIFFLFCIRSTAIAQPTTPDTTGESWNMIELGENDTMLRDVWIDSLHRFAVRIRQKANTITFLRYRKNKWMPIGTRHPKVDMGMLYFEDLNHDGVNEVLLSTYRNMNGNCWMEVFIYDKARDTMRLAGDLNTDYTLDTARNRIEVTYEGSWYMETYKEIYRWHGFNLVPERMVLKEPKENAAGRADYYIEYYENKSHRPNGLKRISRELYNEDNERHTRMWDHFFDLVDQ